MPKTIKRVHALALSCSWHWPKTGTAPTLHSALYYKEGTIQRAGCQLPGDIFKWFHWEPSLKVIRSHPCEVISKAR